MSCMGLLHNLGNMLGSISKRSIYIQYHNTIDSLIIVMFVIDLFIHAHMMIS